jgi:hypothetical protein
MSIVINLNKAKGLTHERRRIARAAEFAPHDEVIMKQIPGAALQAAEAARASIRTKYNTLQNTIDAATTVEQLKTIVSGFYLS